MCRGLFVKNKQPNLDVKVCCEFEGHNHQWWFSHTPASNLSMLPIILLVAIFMADRKVIEWFWKLCCCKHNLMTRRHLIRKLFMLGTGQCFYHAMHCSAKRGIAIACRLSVRPSLCLSVTLVNCDYIGWNSSKIILPLISLGRSLFATPTWWVCSKGNTPKFGPKVTHPLLIWALETFDCKLWPNGYT